jgi:hypothetical protein
VGVLVGDGGKGVSVGSSSVGVLVGDGGNVIAVTGVGSVVLSGEGKVLIASVSITSVVAVESPCEHETRQTLNIPIHNHLIFHFATMTFSSLSPYFCALH